MVCYSPIKAYPSQERSPKTGKHGLTFSGTKNLIEGTLYTVPCGGCKGCRIDRAEAWAIRCYHEARMHQYHLPGSPGSSFVTLTYDPAKLPADNSLSKEVLQTFVRDLRYRTGKAVKVRYLGCGEYGTRKGRAHYHLLVFGFSFPDRVKWQKTRQGHQLYRSELLELVWPHGFALVGDVTFESARYVGGYAMKKIGGERAEEHYRRQSPVDGDWYQVEPEFQLMSLKPGIGESWFRMFKSDVFPSDECIIGGRKLKPPRYYEKMLSEAELGPIKRARKRRAFVKKEDRTPKRLAVREEIAHLRQERLQREVE